ncbi:hypothetical protein EDB84DRAFT_1680118, partial [Lactarius hengduanensis]
MPIPAVVMSTAQDTIGLLPPWLVYSSSQPERAKREHVRQQPTCLYYALKRQFEQEFEYLKPHALFATPNGRTHRHAAQQTARNERSHEARAEDGEARHGTAVGGTSCAAGRHADEVGQREVRERSRRRGEQLHIEGRQRQRRQHAHIAERQCKARSASVIGRQLERTVERELGSSAEALRDAGTDGQPRRAPRRMRAGLERLPSGEPCLGAGMPISDMHGKEGETGKSVQATSGSEILLARRPRQLGGRIFGDGGDGEGLVGPGYVRNGTWKSVPGPCGNMGDYDVEDIVNGEFTRLGMSLLNLRIKDGMVQRGGRRRRERRLLEARLSMSRSMSRWSRRVHVLQGRAPTSTTEQWQPPVVQPDSGNSVDSIVECNCVVLKQFPAQHPSRLTLCVPLSPRPRSRATKVCLLNNIAASCHGHSPSTARTLAPIYEHMNEGPRPMHVLLVFRLKRSPGRKEASERLVFVLNKIDPGAEREYLGRSVKDLHPIPQRCAQDQRGAALHCWASLASGKTSLINTLEHEVVKQEDVDYLISDDGFCPPPHLHSTVSATCHGDPPLTQAEELTKVYNMPIFN